MKVLAVDDEAPIRQWIKYCISHIPSFTCITAANAKEALLMWQAEQPQIIISDIEMPGMNGLEMLKIIQKQDMGIYSIVLTSHEDFEYASTALKLGTGEYMLKTEMTEGSLKQILEKASRELRAQQAKNAQQTSSRAHYLQMLALRQSKEPPSRQELTEQGIFLQNAPVTALCFNVTDDTFAEAVDSCLPDALSNCTPFAIDGSHLIVLANIPDTANASALSLVKACESIINQNGIPCCGISDTGADLTQLCNIIAQARYRCSLDFYQPQQKLFYNEYTQDFTLYEEAFQVEFIKNLLNQDFIAAYNCLENIMEGLTKAMPTDISAVKRLISSALSSFLHFANDISDDANTTADNAKNQILQAHSMQCIRSIATEMLMPIIQLSGSVANYTAPVRHAIEYLEQHYTEKITLGAVAELACFSPEYFSRIFSKETGVTFVTYLNNLRMKHAVSLLEQTDMKVYEIAAKVGFFSLIYFSTAFKKKFGQNPYEYQINYQKGKLYK